MKENLFFINLQPTHHIAIVLLTALDFNSRPAIELVKLGLQDYLPKLERPKLLDIVSQYVKHSQANKPVSSTMNLS